MTAAVKSSKVVRALDSKHIRATLRFIDRNFIWALLLMVGTAAGILLPDFLIPANIVNIFESASFLGCLVLAQGFVLITGNFDLSTEANMIFAGILGALIIIPPATLHTLEGSGGLVVAGGLGLPSIVGVAGMLLAAVFVGLLNGLMVVKLKMNPFMVTLSTSIVLSGLALVVSQSRRLVGIPAGFRWIGIGRIGPPLPNTERPFLAVSVVFLLALFAVAWVVLSKTSFGRQLYAVGSNRKAARAAGIADGRVIIAAYMISGLLSGLAGFLLVGRLGTATAGLSSGNLFLSFAAAVIGGVSLFGGRGSAWGMLGGLLLMASITDALILAQIPAEQINVVSGTVILIAVFIDALRASRSTSR